MKNRLKGMLREGKVALGVTITIGHPDVSEVLGRVGYDWILIDTEHAPLEPATVQNLLQAMSASNSVPLVRVPWNDMVLIKRVLDIGAFGIIVPWVNTREEAERAVKAIRYPPLGVRGFGPRRAGMLDPDYVKTANGELFLGVQIETQQAIDNIDEILSVEGIDAAIVGPADLSLNLGILFQYGDKRFVAAMNKIVRSCQKHHVVAGMLAVDDIGKRAKQGFTLLNKTGDLGLLINTATRSLSESRQAMAEATKKTGQVPLEKRAPGKSKNSGRRNSETSGRSYS
ncbi:MAG: aldolase/citrate lyase family protein [Thaumarchaeota archaeon]|nr:aldolase/citrate lyase family protein [Nitrososphaerota archaeon]